MATLPRWLAGPYRPWFSVKETRVSFAGERGKPEKGLAETTEAERGVWQHLRRRGTDARRTV
ncbi:hypothetical protein CCM_06565 [Cordyceps militaris CM01]|uniref:Uncharacterized protein n=1 Tax=Cordyceps militaris (strain CM01) TaxID=983644 RepID=G3JMW4_CORMM|nr:uncharacterized protein CCM_06565 [Cordyceps militaris CM01]EGX90146.1 hypothetical protein CCM_06565 [Cordyceps militaris CM01]